MEQFDVLVVGSGSGMLIASAAVDQGFKVALVEAGKMGGAEEEGDVVEGRAGEEGEVSPDAARARALQDGGRVVFGALNPEAATVARGGIWRGGDCRRNGLSVGTGLLSSAPPPFDHAYDHHYDRPFHCYPRSGAAYLG